jgi:hypothetical protein
MTKTRWRVYIQYEQWYAVDWAPWFDTKEEADAWISKVGNDGGWDGRVEAEEEEYEDDEEGDD